MITREEFIQKINSFGFDDELKEKALSYYDNPSNSPSKEGVINGDNAELLTKTINRWYGIKNSTKERKPKGSRKDKQLAEVVKLIEKIKDIIDGTDSTKLLSDIRILASDICTITKNKENELNKVKTEKYHQALALLQEYNKATNKNYKIVLEE